MPVLNVTLVILAMVGMLALGRLLARGLTRALEAERDRQPEPPQPRADARRGQPDFQLPHGDTQVIDLVGWKGRAR
jgi:hypothetical protein